MTKLAAESLYDGRTHLGDVIELGRARWEAADADGMGLGVCASRLEAQDKVLKAARSREPVMRRRRRIGEAAV